MALTADTKVQRMPSESAAQSLAVALPASQSRYCCVTSLTLLLSMGISRQITEAGIRATWSNENILKEAAVTVDRHRFSVRFFFGTVMRGSGWKLGQGKFCLGRREKGEAL